MPAKCDNCGNLNTTVRYVENEEFNANVCTSCVPAPKPQPRGSFQTVAQVRAAVDAGPLASDLPRDTRKGAA